MMGLLLTKKLPFKTIFLHPIIRDKFGDKMSKSKGNVIDPLEIIQGISLNEMLKKLEEGNLDKKEYEKAIHSKKIEFPQGIPECGSDALRFGLLAYMLQGRNINLDVQRIIGYRLFCNKIWNSFKFVISKFKPDFNYAINELNLENLNLLNKWILRNLNTTIRKMNETLENYTFGETTIVFHNFWIYDFCDVYIEATKPYFIENNEKEINDALNILFGCLEIGLRLLHPLMPFLTEELYQKLPQFKEKAVSITIAPYPETNNSWNFSEEIENNFQFIFGIIKNIRSLAATVNLPANSKLIGLILPIADEQTLKKKSEQLCNENKKIICFLAKLHNFDFITDSSKIPKGCISSVSSNVQIYINVKDHINIESELERIEKKINQTNDFIEKLKKKMNVKDYEKKVPKDVQDINNEKMNQYLLEIEKLKESMGVMKNLN